jgi:hypothetical protein
MPLALALARPDLIHDHVALEFGKQAAHLKHCPAAGRGRI